ncbi:MAG: hypothetical protein Q9160_001894 [Pyrenula sp. 1 TL-2023]
MSFLKGWVDRHFGDDEPETEPQRRPKPVDLDLAYGSFYDEDVRPHGSRTRAANSRTGSHEGLRPESFDSARDDAFDPCFVQYMCDSPKKGVDTSDSDTDSSEGEGGEPVDPTVLKVRLIEFPRCLEKGPFRFYHVQPTAPKIFDPEVEEMECRCTKFTLKIDLEQFVKVEEIEPRIVVWCHDPERHVNCSWCKEHKHMQECPVWKAIQNPWSKVNDMIGKLGPAEQTVEYQDYNKAIDEMGLKSQQRLRILKPDDDRKAGEMALNKPKAERQK